MMNKQKKIIFWSILFAFPLIGMGIDLISPALPNISYSLHTSSHAAKFLIPVYLLAFAVGQPFFGAWSESAGRRNLLLIGLAGFILSSFVCIFLTNIKLLCLFRMGQGFFMGAIAVLGRTILTDILSKEELTRSFTWVATMWGIGPIIGPFIGGYLTANFDWSANFYFFVVYTVILFVVLFSVLKETHHRRQAFSLRKLAVETREILSQQAFMGYTLLMSLSFSLMVLFHTMAPFLIQVIYQQSAIFYGNIALTLGFSYFFATIICRQLLRKFTPDQIICTAILAIIITLVTTSILNDQFGSNLGLMVICSAVCFFLVGFIFPSALGKASLIIQQGTQGAGNANAIMASIMLGITALITILASRIPVKSNEVLFIAFGLCIFLLAMSYWLLLREKNIVSLNTGKE